MVDNVKTYRKIGGRVVKSDGTIVNFGNLLEQVDQNILELKEGDKGDKLVEQLSQDDALYEGETTVDSVDTYFRVELDNGLSDIVINEDTIEADTTLTATSGAAVYIQADGSGSYTGTTGNNVTVEVVDNNVDGVLAVSFDGGTDTITIDLAGSTQTANDIQTEVNNLTDFIATEETSGNFTVADDAGLTQTLDGGQDEFTNYDSGTKDLTVALDSSVSYADSDIELLINNVNEVTLVQVSGQDTAVSSTEWIGTVGMAATLLIFSKEIESVEIYHAESTLETFTVNGIDLQIGSGGWRSKVGGILSNEVTIPAGITCTVARLI